MYFIGVEKRFDHVHKIIKMQKYKWLNYTKLKNINKKVQSN